jgi:hypothetical protein
VTSTKSTSNLYKKKDPSIGLALTAILKLDKKLTEQEKTPAEESARAKAMLVDDDAADNDDVLLEDDDVLLEEDNDADDAASSSDSDDSIQGQRKGKPGPGVELEGNILNAGFTTNESTSKPSEYICWVRSFHRKRHFYQIIWYAIETTEVTTVEYFWNKDKKNGQGLKSSLFESDYTQFDDQA